MDRIERITRSKIYSVQVDIHELVEEREDVVHCNRFIAFGDAASFDGLAPFESHGL